MNDLNLHCIFTFLVFTPKQCGWDILEEDCLIDQSQFNRVDTAIFEYKTFTTILKSMAEQTRQQSIRNLQHDVTRSSCDTPSSTCTKREADDKHTNITARKTPRKMTAGPSVHINPCLLKAMGDHITRMAVRANNIRINIDETHPRKCHQRRLAKLIESINTDEKCSSFKHATISSLTSLQCPERAKHVTKDFPYVSYLKRISGQRAKEESS